jgi:hypothetical protein
MIGVLRCLARFAASFDARWLYSAALIGGLSLGNHVATAACGSWIFLCLVGFRGVRRDQIVRAGVFAVIGALVYLYLPVRAATNPPLDTGRPVTVERFIRHTTDARDRALRTSPPSAASSSAQSSKPGRLTQLGKDLVRLSLPLGVLPALTGLGALCAFARRQPLFFAPALGIAITTLLFFSNWDPDPWLVVIAVVSVGCALALCALAARTESHRLLKPLPLVLLALFSVLAARELPLSLDHLSAQRTFDEPARAALRVLDSTPRYGMAITEPSWFVSRYLQQLEGYRTDVVLLYLPSLLFPAYFDPAVIETPKGIVESTQGENPAEPRFENVATALQAGALNGPVFVELTELLAAPFREILILNKDGKSVVVNQTPGYVDREYASARAVTLRTTKVRALSEPEALRADTMNYVEVCLAHETAALRALGRF